MLGIILGILLAAAASYCIVSWYINNSVVSGDSKGSYKDFNTTPMFYKQKKNKVGRDYPV